jgi:hypothetical protein
MFDETESTDSLFNTFNKSVPSNISYKSYCDHQGRSEDYPFRGVQDNFLPTKGRG